MGELVVAVGLASRTGRRPDNQDFCVAYLGTAAERATVGVLAVVADGVGGAKGGRIAAELACRDWVAAYLDQPYTLGIAACAERALAPFNRWLHAMGRSDPAMQGAATTFVALVLRGRQAHALHIGDSRAWHFRDGALVALTTDHCLAAPDLRHVLYRAVGLEPTLRLDHTVQQLAVHDRLLLTSDGVHDVLSRTVLTRLLGARGSAERDAALIVEAALAGGAADNCTALVLDVVALPEPTQADIAALAVALPILPVPKVGDLVDGFGLERQLSDGRYSRLFVARNGDGGVCVLKFPKTSLLSERGARMAFMREALVGTRVHSPYVAHVLSLPPERQTRLYVAMPFYAGETLEARLRRGRLPYAAGLMIAAGIARGVIALHRRGIIHRDIKPDNVMLPSAGAPRLLDLGAARLPHLEEEIAQAEIPGTPSFLAPELYQGEAGNEASDQFALGVTFYRMFTGALPYGEIEAFSRPRFDRPLEPARLRPDMPAWLAETLKRAVAVAADQRFADVGELLAAIEGGSARAVPTVGRLPWMQSHPVRFWQGMCLLLAVLLGVTLLLH